MADLCGVSGPGDGPGGRECNLFNPGVFNPGGRAPVYELYTRGQARLQHRVRQLRAERRRRVAAERRRTAGCARSSATRRRRRFAPATASRTTATASASTRASTTAIPATRSRRTARRRARSSRWCPPGESWPVLLRTAGAARAVAGHSGRARLSDGDRLQQRREPVSSEFQDAVRAVVLGRPPADARPADGDRSALRRHAARRRHGDRELERGQLDDERIPRRVQAGAGQPAGQHGVGRAARANSFAYFGPGTGHVPAADLPGELQRRARRATSGDAALYTGANWTNTARLAELAPRNPNPGGAANTLFTHRGVPHESWSRPATRATSSSSIRTSATPNVTTNGEYHEVRLAADQPAARAVRRPRGRRQLRRSPSATRPRSTRCASDADARAVDARRAARAQDDGDLRAAVRPRQAVRRRREPRGSTPSIGGWSLNLTGRVQSGSDPELRQRPRRGHDDRRAPRRVQDPHRSGDEDRLHAAAGHHRQHDQGVQHQRDVGHGLRRARAAHRPLPGAGERTGLHPAGPRRLRAARRVRRGSDLHPVRSERQEALHVLRHARASSSRWTS